MAKFNQDGNLIGRIGALAVLAGVAVLLCRLCGPAGVCPTGPGSCCFFSSDKPSSK